ncbi:flagellar hook-length control protein FliK [uncultured Massilia sp.]|uniref:flagellar hook-length control protein FliK n=1 Tax=uncultured Massilia sp. TaxID=169973 RepID=UPI0025F40AF4|nr:flagellar hook-length control protein FliK [uncultured Massilia sp.]
MQTTTLPIQLNNTAGVQRNGGGNANGSDGAQFGAMLSNEMEQRAAPPAPAPAPKPASSQSPAPAKPKAADKPAQPDDGASRAADGQPAPATAGGAGAAGADSAAEAADTTDERAASDDAAAGDPAAAMLALMASLHTPAQDSAAGAADAAGQAFDALAGARGKRSDTAQLASLQAALKTAAKDAGVDATGARIFGATGAPKNPALAAAGAELGAGAKATAATTADGAAADGIDLRALQGGAVKAELKPEAEFSLQQARDAALLQAAQKEAAPAAAAIAQAQPGALATVDAAAAAAEQLTARVGTSAWENQVGQKVVYMVGSEEQTASLTLNPPDLGPMQVVLSVTGDQASVTFSAEQLEVRQALENALPRLREMMSESGIALGNATVNAGMQDNRQAQDQPARGSRGFGRGDGNGRDDGIAVGEATVRPARTVGAGGLGAVDTFA